MGTCCYLGLRGMKKDSRLPRALAEKIVDSNNRKREKTYMELQSVDKSSYKGDYEAAVLEQWKTCVEMANSTSDKRNNSNSIYITINAALLAVISFSLDYKSILLSAVGIAVCVLWQKSIKSYKQLSSKKYHIINDIEKQLPLAPFTYEWDKLKNEDQYKGLITFEKILPVVFVIIYVISIIWPFHELIFRALCCK